MSVKSILLGDDSDWLVVAGDIVIGEGAEAVESLIISTIPVERGTWPFDLRLGTNWTAVRDKYADDSLVVSLVVQPFGEGQIPGVVIPSAADFAVDRGALEDRLERRILVEGTILTSDGEAVALAFEA